MALFSVHSKAAQCTFFTLWFPIPSDSSFDFLFPDIILISYFLRSIWFLIHSLSLFFSFKFLISSVPDSLGLILQFATSLLSLIPYSESDTLFIPYLIPHFLGCCLLVSAIGILSLATLLIQNPIPLDLDSLFIRFVIGFLSIQFYSFSLLSALHSSSTKLELSIK